MSSSGRMGYSLPNYKVRFRLIQRPASSSRADRVKNMIGIWRMIGSPGYPQTDEFLKAWCERAYDRSYNPGGAVRQIGAILENGSRIPFLKKIKTPTLVIHGAQDVLVPARGGVDTARHIRGAKLQIIEGMGHDLPVELSEYLGQLMVEHFREASPVARQTVM